MYTKWIFNYTLSGRQVERRGRGETTVAPGHKLRWRLLPTKWSGRLFCSYFSGTDL